MGKYFDRFPEDRRKVFLVTKAKSSDPAELDRYLATSLERLKSDFVDMFFIHQVSDVEKQLTPETRKWAEKAKSRGHVRRFGFSTHKNMDLLPGRPNLKRSGKTRTSPASAAKCPIWPSSPPMPPRPWTKPPSLSRRKTCSRKIPIADIMKEIPSLLA